MNLVYEELSIALFYYNKMINYQNNEYVMQNGIGILHTQFIGISLLSSILIHYLIPGEPELSSMRSIESNQSLFLITI